MSNLKRKQREFFLSPRSKGKGCYLILSTEVVYSYLSKFEKVLTDLGWVKDEDEDSWEPAKWIHPCYPEISTFLWDTDLWQCAAPVACLSAHIDGMFFLKDVNIDYTTGISVANLTVPCVLSTNGDAVRTRKKMRQALKLFTKDAELLTNSSEEFVKARKICGSFINRCPGKLTSIVGTTSFDKNILDKCGSRIVSPHEIEFYKDGKTTLTFSIKDQELTVGVGSERYTWNTKEQSTEDIISDIEKLSENMEIKRLVESPYISEKLADPDGYALYPGTIADSGYSDNVSIFSNPDIYINHFKKLKIEDNYSLLMESLEDNRHLINNKIYEMTKKALMLIPQEELNELPKFKFILTVPYFSKVVLLYFHEIMGEDDKPKSIKAMLHIGTDNYYGLINHGNSSNYLRNTKTDSSITVEGLSTVIRNFCVLCDALDKFPEDKYGIWEDRWVPSEKLTEEGHKEYVRKYIALFENA